MNLNRRIIYKPLLTEWRDLRLPQQGLLCHSFVNTFPSLEFRLNQIVYDNYVQLKKKKIESKAKRCIQKYLMQLKIFPTFLAADVWFHQLPGMLQKP